MKTEMLSVKWPSEFAIRDVSSPNQMFFQREHICIKVSCVSDILP
jgi:hypothetical protein